ncbi:hypothetical protein [Actinophytocola gossypii]|uniref:DUF3040 domain-containing protein n=1 Tax=Actinophytocola gossypii TaxID=2812003 RepID=A0ABT2JGF5_9PSEU|nr:hypothetical protein [Actinophytocola gossypii]MCT2586949.1 hypothetical protein [Actinophytocola gossypii]
MTTLRSRTASTPEEARSTDSPTSAPDRRTVELAGLAVLTTEPDPPEPTSPVVVPTPPVRTSFAPTRRDDWLRLAERVVGDWAATLRAALGLALLFAAAVLVIGLALGPLSAAATAVVGLVVFLIGRRRGDSN